jgi:hypothetical protein
VPDDRWQYADYVTMTGRARYDRLSLHIQEVSQRIGPDTSGRSHSRSTGALEPYLDRLMTRLDRYERELGLDGGGPRLVTVPVPGPLGGRRR